MIFPEKCRYWKFNRWKQSWFSVFLNAIIGKFLWDKIQMQCYSWGGAMGHRPIQQKNGPLTTEIAILNLERMAHWNFKFIGNKWKMAHTILPSYNTADGHATPMKSAVMSHHTWEKIVCRTEKVTKNLFFKLEIPNHSRVVTPPQN